MKGKTLERKMPAGEAEKLKQLKSRVRKRTRELVAVNRALQESEERYRELVANMPNGVLVHKKGRIVFVNAIILTPLSTSLRKKYSANRFWILSIPPTARSSKKTWPCAWPTSRRHKVMKSASPPAKENGEPW